MAFPVFASNQAVDGLVNLNKKKVFFLVRYMLEVLNVMALLFNLLNEILMHCL